MKRMMVRRETGDPEGETDVDGGARWSLSGC